MSEITREQVDEIAHLSRLSFKPEESEKLAEQLTSILGYVEKLEEIDTKAIEPTSHGLEITNVMREDEPRQSLSAAQALSNAPETEDDCFRVPPIIQESGPSA